MTKLEHYRRPSFLLTLYVILHERFGKSGREAWRHPKAPERGDAYRRQMKRRGK